METVNSIKYLLEDGCSPTTETQIFIEESLAISSWLRLPEDCESVAARRLEKPEI